MVKKMFDWLNRLVGCGDKGQADAKAPQQGDLAAGGEAAAGAFPVSQMGGQGGQETPSPVSRMILLDRTGQIIGYEFVSRSGMLGVRVADPRNQKINDQLLIRAVLGMGAERISQFRQIWLTVGEATLAGGLLEGLPARATVILVRLAAPGPGPLSVDLQQQAKALKAKGFRLGLAGFAGSESCLAWLPLVDVVALDIGGYAPDELVSTLDQLRARQPGIKVLARRIDSYEEYEYCLAQGFDNFSGKFLTHRENWPPQPPLNADRIRLCDLLNRLRGGAELTEVAEGLKLSPELSYRFLRYINSAGMGTSGHIGSLEQGALYLGREKLYRWLTLLLFNGPGGQPTDGALLEQALVRGRMLELMASGKMSHVQCDELFIVGVFSLLDVLLRLPLDVAVRPLQLPTAVSQALLDGQGPYAAYLKLAKVSEESEESEFVDPAPAADSTATVAALAGEIGLSVDQVNSHHLHAVAWAQQLQGDQPAA